jgi:hypothetical protein
MQSVSNQGGKESGAICQRCQKASLVPSGHGGSKLNVNVHQ